MRHPGILALALVPALLVPASADAGGPTTGLQLDGEVLLGYTGGAGAQLSTTASRIAEGFPLHLRFGVGYARVAPGSATDARRIFINNATNGVPEKAGWMWDFRMDFLYPTSLPGLRNAFLVVGPRHSRFVGNFKFIGGNEDFDVKSSQWGVGIGLESRYTIRGGLDLVLGGGYDYFAESTLEGHDTSYAPDGDHVNPREDYTYDDADEAIGQPKHELRALIGLSFGLWSLGG
jgi:hypothetical protein